MTYPTRNSLPMIKAVVLCIRQPGTIRQGRLAVFQRHLIKSGYRCVLARTPKLCAFIRAS
jgi:hypothetical protein